MILSSKGSLILSSSTRSGLTLLGEWKGTILRRMKNNQQEHAEEEFYS
jgi:hypothetical protein